MKSIQIILKLNYLLVVLLLYSCVQEESPELAPHAAIDEKVSTRIDSLNSFPYCSTDLELDTSLIYQKANEKTNNSFFNVGNQAFYRKDGVMVNCRILHPKKDSCFLILEQKNKIHDTIFTFKLKTDSLFTWQKKNKYWEFKTRLSHCAPFNVDQVFKFTESYFYSEQIENKIEIIKVMDIDYSMTSGHGSKSRNIKISDFIINDFNKVIAIKYKCDYYYCK
jgi:hypothetical protein